VLPCVTVARLEARVDVVDRLLTDNNEETSCNIASLPRLIWSHSA